VEITPEEDIVFTDPDNPDANLPELSTLLSAAPKRRGPWEQSETIAKRRAAREGKPLLIWFTDSARSPMCKALSEELFSKPDFEKWASEKLIRLRVDANVEVDDPDLSLGDKETRMVDLKAYVARMKKQYKVLGHPVVVMLNPSGEVIGRYRGYKRGDADYTWGLIKQGEAASAHAYESWRSSLEKKGYREWRDRNDRKVFAKLTSYSNGTLTLIEPDGTRSRTHENKLSDKDLEWLAGQKRIRGL
jgi:thioredoxin-related protein